MFFQTLGRDLISNEWKIGGRRPPLCMGIVWTKISSEKKIFVQTRTNIHFWRTKITIDLIIVISSRVDFFLLLLLPFASKYRDQGIFQFFQAEEAGHKQQPRVYLLLDTEGIKGSQNLINLGCYVHHYLCLLSHQHNQQVFSTSMLTNVLGTA